MPRIFETFGYHIDDNSAEAELNRKAAWCPFMDCPCDGGGNRYLSHINLKNNSELRTYFNNDLKEVPSGVCSLQLQNGEPPWVVCPRRLLVLGRSNVGNRQYQQTSESILLAHSGYSTGTVVGVWPEVKIKYTDDQSGKSFDYTFDYILMSLEIVPLEEASRLTGMKSKPLQKLVQKAGYEIGTKNEEQYIEDFPVGYPCVIEIMTSSTSGGNKKKRTTIPMAFEDSILGRYHTGPGINYRQVWARMVSQFIVKSEVGLAWGGKTFWVLQDTLAEYISKSTALNFNSFIADNTAEVNVISLSYGNSYKDHDGIMEIKEGILYSGPISSSTDDNPEPSFQDMIRAPVCPPLSTLLQLLAKRSPTNKIIIQ